MPRLLSIGQVKEYIEEGILYPINVLSEEEVTLYRTEFESLEAYLKGLELPMVQPHLHFDWAYRLATHPNVLDAIEDIIGPNILIHSTTFFAKNPNDQTFVSWHQDGHYWQMEDPRVISAWIALSWSTKQSGCLRVLPQSHLMKSVQHEETAIHENNLLGSGLEAAIQIDEAKVVDVELQPGQMSFHHHNILHGSNPNTSNDRRIGFAVRYLAPGTKQNRKHHQVVLARGKTQDNHYKLLDQPPQDNREENIREMKKFIAWQTEVRRSYGRIND